MASRHERLNFLFQEIKPKKGKPKRRKFNKDLVPPPFDNMIVSTER